MPSELRLGAHRYDLACRVLVMADLEPVAVGPAAVVLAAEAARAGGADLLAVAMPRRPGTPPMGEGEELDAASSAVEAVASRFDLPVAIETSRPEVLRAAAKAGAALADDPLGLADPGYLQAVAELRLPVVAHGRPGETPAAALDRAVAAGLAADDIIVAAELDAIATLAASGHTVLFTFPEHDPRTHPGMPLSAAALGVVRGARVVRSPDVAATVRVARTIERILSA